MVEETLPSNWGPWGDRDQLGTLNLIDARAQERAAAEVLVGQHVSLARTSHPVPLTTGLGPVGSPATVPAAVLQVVNFNGARPPAMTDSLLINTSNAALTLDAVLDRTGVQMQARDAGALRGGWDTNQPAGVPVPGPIQLMLVLAPPRITGTTGLVVNPIAIF